ncbi:hypothetical protein GCM10009827_062760 [Dactylosporangium maewongense]|uniref:Uncharacterized protein n=1 Tax=Dactylosporangium maewongense TaxID=634393 RepID=A0ABN2B836_9ACTN
MTVPPPAWANLIEGLTLLAQHPANPGYPLDIEHGQLFVLADAKAFTDDELSRLETLGFTVNRDSEYYAFRFDSAGS